MNAKNSTLVAGIPLDGFRVLARSQYIQRIQRFSSLYIRILAMGIALMTFSATAASVSWVGGFDNNNWFEPQNWSSGVVPDATTDIQLKSGDTPVVTGATAHINSFQIKSGGTLTFQNGAAAAMVIHGNTQAKNDGTIVLNDGQITFEGNITIQNNGSFDAGSGTVNMSGGTWNQQSGGTFDAGTSTVNFNGTSDQTINGDVTFYNVNFETTGEVTIDDAVTVLNDATLGGGTTLDAPDLTVEGTFDVEGVYTFPGDITINTGSKLLLSASDRIQDSTNMVLAGGTFETGNFNETLGTLTLSQSSTIDFTAGGTSAITFADSSAQSWSGTLTVVNWQSGDQLIFDGTGITETQLGQIQFVNPDGYSGTFFAEFDTNYTGAGVRVVPIIPEPGTYAFLLMLGSTLAFHERKRIRKLCRRITAPPPE